MAPIHLLPALAATLLMMACGGEMPREGTSRAERLPPPESGQPPEEAEPQAADEGQQEVPGGERGWGIPRSAVDISRIGYDRGDPRAPIAIVEFSDFGCPYCRRFHARDYPVLHEEFIARGTVRWKYVPFVLGKFKNGLEAARASECAAEQGRFFEMHERLYETQSEWKQTGEPLGYFVSLAAEIGVDRGSFRACYEDGRTDSKLRTAVRAGAALGIRATPTFFVNGFPVQGAIPADTFREFLDAILDELEKEPGS